MSTDRDDFAKSPEVVDEPKPSRSFVPPSRIVDTPPSPLPSRVLGGSYSVNSSPESPQIVEQTISPKPQQPVVPIVQKKVFAPPRRFQAPAAASNRPSQGSSNTSSEPVPKPRYFKAMYTKMTKKKHKTWEGDGILVVRQVTLELFDSDNKPLGKKSQFKAAEISSISEGSTYFIGGKEVLVEDEISEETYNSGTCFSSISTAGAAVPTKSSTLNTGGRGFQCPQRENNGAAAVSRPAILKPRHDPNAQGAVILSSPKKGEENSVAVVLDPYLSDKMRTHQREGVQFLYNCVMKPAGSTGAVLADDMGLGKTLQTIALIWTLLKQGPTGNPVCKKILIITPSSLVKNWKHEFKKWLGEERIRVWALTAGESSVSEFSKSPLFPVLVISYEMFRRSIADILKINWGLVACDEGHRLKNVAAKVAEALNQLPCMKRVVLTGTPVQNNLKVGSWCSFINIFNQIKSLYRSFSR